MKLHEYKKSRSVFDSGPMSLTFLRKTFFSSETIGSVETIFNTRSNLLSGALICENIKVREINFIQGTIIEKKIKVQCTVHCVLCTVQRNGDQERKTVFLLRETCHFFPKYLVPSVLPIIGHKKHIGRHIIIIS